MSCEGGDNGALKEETKDPLQEGRSCGIDDLKITPCSMICQAPVEK